MALSPSQTSFSAKFVVKHCVSELVVPAKPTPNEVKKLSDIDDQTGLRVYLPMIWFYRKNEKNPSMEEGKEKDPAKVIKEALGRALVYYYPLAGRLKEGLDGKLLVDCNGEGVLFIEADANVSFDQLGHPIQPPFPYFDEIFYNFPASAVGVLGCPLLSIQAIRMRCGSFILAIKFNHVILDGFGLSQFLNTLGEMAKGAQTPSIQPVWQRELLNARSPPTITQIHHEYLQQSTDIDHPDFDETNVVNRSFFFGPNQIIAIRNHLPPHLANCTTRWELLTACIWKCRTLALNPNPEEVVQVSCTFNGRLNKNIINDLSLPLGYYGNVIAFSAAVSKAGVLCEKPLGYAVELVRIAKSKMNAEYIRSVADFMVIRRRPGDKLKGNYFISDITRIGFEDVDFGWGLPEYAGPPMSDPLFDYNVKYKNNGEDGILVLICLPLMVMDRFQQELNKIIQEKA